MGHKREILPSQFATKEALSQDMAGIGFLITAEGSKNPNIENTLVAVSIEGLSGDFRSLALLVSWLEIHHGVVNADRLTRMISLLKKDQKFLCFWSALASNVLPDPRFKKLKKLYRGKRLDLLDVGMDFQLSRYGEDPRFVGACLKVPANTLRNRPRDIMPPTLLAKHHSAYRYRIIIGPSYRADQWAILEGTKQISPSDLARLSYSSFGSAWQAKQDYSLLA